MSFAAIACVMQPGAYVMRRVERTVASEPSAPIVTWWFRGEFAIAVLQLHRRQHAHDTRFHRFVVHGMSSEASHWPFTNSQERQLVSFAQRVREALNRRCNLDTDRAHSRDRADTADERSASNVSSIAAGISSATGAGAWLS